MQMIEKRLQDAEQALRNWAQAWAGELDNVAMMELTLICDQIRLERAKIAMKFKWE